MPLLKRIIRLPMWPFDARRRRAKFDTICQRCGLKLDYDLNQPGVSILEEVFVKRGYADYFPFYQPNTVLDIGGHFGYFAMFAALNSAPNSRIVTVEPSARNIEVLRSNIARMGLNQIQAVHGAVADETGTAIVHVTQAHNCSLMAEHSREFAQGEQVATETVATFSLTDVLDRNNLAAVDVLKLDCEGAEYGIVSRSPAEVLRRARVIMMEFHDLKDPQRSGLSIIEQLTEKGFRVVKFYHLPSNMNLNYGKIVAVRD